MLSHAKGDDDDDDDDDNKDKAHEEAFVPAPRETEADRCTLYSQS